MLTDPKLRSQADALWDKLWAGGLSNPMDAIEQFSYLLFFKQPDDKRNPVPENDIPDILACWQHRHDPDFQAERVERLAALREEAAQERLTTLQSSITHLQSKIDQLTASFGSRPNKSGRTATTCPPAAAGNWKAPRPITKVTIERLRAQQREDGHQVEMVFGSLLAQSFDGRGMGDPLR